MKKTLITLSSAALIALFVVGCSKEDDTTSPVIALVGSNPFILSNIGDTYVEPGFTATDDNDGTITSKVTVDESELNEDSTGTYKIRYAVSDDAGNSGTAERSVTVKNTADALKGNYSTIIACPGFANYNYTDQVKMSPSINNRIYFGKFGDYAGIENKLYVNIVGGSVTIPSQTYNCGSPLADRNFTGNGTVSTSGGVTTISLTVTETIIGQAPVTCTYTFTK